MKLLISQLQLVSAAATAELDQWFFFHRLSTFVVCVSRKQNNIACQRRLAILCKQNKILYFPIKLLIFGCVKALFDGPRAFGEVKTPTSTNHFLSLQAFCVSLKTIVPNETLSYPSLRGANETKEALLHWSNVSIVSYAHSPPFPYVYPLMQFYNVVKISSWVCW